MNNLLDFTPPDEAKGKDFSEIVRWWEKKRLLFNILIAICGLVNIILSHKFKTKFIVPSIFYGIAANIFFSTGILLEAWDNYYFNGRIHTKNYRLPIFIIGVLFSAFITLIYDPDFIG